MSGRAIRRYSSGRRYISTSSTHKEGRVVTLVNVYEIHIIRYTLKTMGTLHPVDGTFVIHAA